MQKATFGAGCFWGVESLFRALPGVKEALCGYAGGTLDNPTYRDVCGGATGHAEVVEVEFDETQISYEQLLATFWQCHDPTTRNRQGPDVGTQYRSVIFYHTPEQRVLAEASKHALEQSKKWKNPVVTEIAPAAKFYRAEEYHQRYFEKRGIAPSCHAR